MSPEQIVHIARERGVRAIAITDHDAIAGIEPARRTGASLGVEVINGVELSALCDDTEVHLLGYFFDPGCPPIRTLLDQLRADRMERARQIVRRLNKLGFKIPFDLILRKMNDGVICRPLIADVLVEEGIVFSAHEAFEKYLGDSRPANVPKKARSPDSIVRTLHEAGGLAFLAHPAVGLSSQVLSRVLDSGLDGIEIYHPDHTAGDRMRFNAMAVERGLLTSGGSDCHGGRGGQIRLGSMTVPYTLLEAMKTRIAESNA